MEAKVIQEFKGKINEVDFYNEVIYYTTEYVIAELEEVLGRSINESNIVSAFASAFGKLFWKQELDIPEFEREIYSNIQKGYFIEDECPLYRGEYFEEANELLAKLFKE